MSGNPISGAPVKDKFYDNFSSKCINLDCGKINACDIRTERVIIQNDPTLQFPQLLTRVELQDTVTFDVNGDSGVVPYDTVSIDDFVMYDVATSSFTLPATGWWKITYNTCFQLSFQSTPSSGGIFSGFVAKSVGPQVVMKDIADLGTLVSQPPVVALRNTETSDVQFFNAGESFTVLFAYSPQGNVPSTASILGQVSPVAGSFTYCVVQRIK